MAVIAYGKSLESQFTQQDAASGTDFLNDRVTLHDQSKVDLSGGTGGTSGQTVYTAPNGVVVTSSAPVYSNSNYYYMEYMFNNSISSSYNVHSHFLSSGATTLTFDFGEGHAGITDMMVYPRARDDGSSNYRIEVSDDNATWTEVVPWVTTTHDDSTPYGTEHRYTLNTTARYIRMELTQNGSWGSCLDEIQFTGPSNLKYALGGSHVLTGTNPIETTKSIDKVSVEIDALEPAGTELRYLVSFDGKTTWKKFDATTSAFVDVLLDDIRTTGMLTGDVLAVPSEVWLGAFDVDFHLAVDLSTIDQAVSPELRAFYLHFHRSGALELLSPSSPVANVLHGMNLSVVEFASLASSGVGTTHATINGAIENENPSGAVENMLHGFMFATVEPATIENKDSAGNTVTYSTISGAVENENPAGAIENVLKGFLFETVQPAYVVRRVATNAQVAPAYAVGELPQKIVTEKVESMFQPRKSPMEWHPEVWNGQKPKA